MKIRLVVHEMFNADRRTVVTKPMVDFRSFANASEKKITAVEANNRVLFRDPYKTHKLYVMGRRLKFY